MDLQCNEQIADRHGNGPVVLADPRYMKRLLLLEPFFVINEDYFITIQDEISVEMRRICLGWLSEVIQCERMDPALLPLTANLMDRYLNMRKINISILQLLGGACLMIATKLRQPNPITPAMVVSYTANAYTTDEVKMFEQLVLIVLQWNVNAVVFNDFLDPLLIRLPDHERIYTVTKYQAVNLTVKIVCEYDFAFWQASHIAMGVIAAILKRMPDLGSIWPHANNLTQYFHEITDIDIRTIESRIAAMEVFVSRIVQSAREVEELINLMDKHDDPFPGSPPSPESPTDILSFYF